jgi:hypothetical protein
MAKPNFLDPSFHWTHVVSQAAVSRRIGAIILCFQQISDDITSLLCLEKPLNYPNSELFGPGHFVGLGLGLRLKSEIRSRTRTRART